MADGNRFWEALQARVCVKCIDGDGKGNCRLPHGETCPIAANLDKIVDAVNEVYSPSIEPYEMLLRKRVCAECEQQDDSGLCRRREAIECALDRYFPMIVEIIEQTQLQARALRT